MGFATGWFLFEEIIIGAVAFIIFGVIVWFGHERKRNRVNAKLKSSSR